MCAVGSLIYIFGGYTGHYDDSLHIFDTVTNAWKVPQTQGTPPTGRAFHTAQVVGTKIFVFGGYNGVFNLNDVIILHTDTLKWTCPRVKGAYIPHGRFEHAMTVIEDKIFLMGGGNHTTWLNDIFMFDTKTITWSIVNANGLPPRIRCAHCWQSVGKHIILFGGYDGKTRLKDTRIFDSESGVWQPAIKIPSPSGRAAHSSCVIQDRLFIFGGYDGKKKLSDVYMFNSESLQWTVPEINGSAPNGRSYHSCCVIEKKMYLFGGYDGNSRSNEMYILEQALPSLTRLCLSFIKNNRNRVGNIQRLPEELRALIEN